VENKTATPLGVPRAGLLTAGACSVLVLVAGCGVVGSSSSSPSSASGSFSAYQTCLRQHGVSIPTARPTGGPGGFGGGGDSSAFQQARQACASLRPSGGFGGGGFGGQFASEIQAFRSCMAAHGETIPSTRPTAPPSPEPSASASSEPDRFLNGLNPANPGVAAAVKACQSKLPTFGSGGSAS
jgi:hypothetical protein